MARFKLEANTHIAQHEGSRWDRERSKKINKKGHPTTQQLTATQASFNGGAQRDAVKREFARSGFVLSRKANKIGEGNKLPGS